MYIYIDYSTKTEDIEKSYYTDLNNTFFGPLWILTVNLK